MGIKKFFVLVMALVLCLTAAGATADNPTGSVTPAYTEGGDGKLKVWGEGTANAENSFVLELYSDNTLIATSKLNNIDGIIDGDVYVTWSFKYPSEEDGYWTTIWEKDQPKADVQPTKVVLYADGKKVAENTAKMSAPDNLKPVVWKELVDQLIRVDNPVVNPERPVGDNSSISSSMPQTGDGSSLMLWFCLLTLAAAGVVAMKKRTA